ncbi:MAG: bifunctional folylpolyglutamate synthase/dihydrofolate synthase [Bacteroidales bacterium]|nr:bifunctional folylpolyglutamate synthase/dihydrofolate synthase [Bacteroidales bacterium]
MNYQETIEWLFSRLPMFQRQGKIAYKKDMSNITALCKLNDNPQNKFKSIHIAGTNGKGSVSHILSSVLQTAGYKTGLYTSPHLKDFRERIRINGKMISEESVINFVKRFMPDFIKIKPSFFEMSVAMAFDHFAENKVDFAIIEVGLGGRLDSTNIITPILSVITNISIDHTQFLGNTTEEIAQEKAGIIKPNIPVVIGEKDEKTSDIFIKKAKKNDSDIYFADSEYNIDCSLLNTDYKQVFNVRKNHQLIFKNLTTDLIGLYQKKNIITSLKIIDFLSEKYSISEDNIYSGLLNVHNNTGFAGRWHILGYNPLIVADTGHNIAGINEILNQLKTTAYKQLHFIFGTVNDKDIDTILNLLPRTAVYYFTQANIPRALDETELQCKAKKFQLYGETYSTVNQAIKKAKEQANSSDMILICGSTFIVAEII